MCFLWCTHHPPSVAASVQERRHPPGSPTNKVMASTLLSGQERME